MRKSFFYLINFTWGLLQNLLGIALLIKYRHCKKEWFFGSLLIYHDGSWGGISLGMFIIMNGNRDEKWKNETKVHEYGHCIQSIILGPLYLLIIGLPSLIWCNTKKYQDLRKNTGKSYFEFYPEKWANYLGTLVTKMPSPK